MDHGVTSYPFRPYRLLWEDSEGFRGHHPCEVRSHPCFPCARWRSSRSPPVPARRTSYDAVRRGSRSRRETARTRPGAAQTSPADRQATTTSRGRCATRAWGDFNKIDIKLPQPTLMTDIPRLRQGGLGGAVLVGLRAVGAAGARRPSRRRWSRSTSVYRDAPEVSRRRSSWRARPTTSSASSRRRQDRLDDGHGRRPLDRQLAGSALRMFSTLGVGYMTLTHSDNVPWADCGDRRRRSATG